jgi:hypothetical protein
MAGSYTIVVEREHMTIRYSNGRMVEAILLSHTGSSMRVATQDSDEVTEYHEINGAWVSEHGEPVDVRFAWMQNADRPLVTETDCICSHELAARLIRLLFMGEDAPRMANFQCASGSACQQVS